MIHHAIIVTSLNSDRLDRLRKKAVVYSEETRDPLGRSLFNVTQIAVSGPNSYYTFVVTPDGSKPGWQHANDAVAARDKLKELLNEDPSGIDWVEVRYGQADQFDWEPLRRYGEVTDARGHIVLGPDDEQIVLPLEAESIRGTSAATEAFLYSKAEGASIKGVEQASAGYDNFTTSLNAATDHIIVARAQADGWNYVSDNPQPPHGGQVLVSYMVGKDGPFIGSARKESGPWEFGSKHNPAVEVFAWKEHEAPAKPR
jgi:hypothetical protein